MVYFYLSSKNNTHMDKWIEAEETYTLVSFKQSCIHYIVTGIFDDLSSIDYLANYILWLKVKMKIILFLMSFVFSQFRSISNCVVVALLTKSCMKGYNHLARATIGGRNKYNPQF